MNLKDYILVKVEGDKLLKAGVEDPTIVVASHGMFMKEVYSVLSSEEGSVIPRELPGRSYQSYQNTGLARYRFSHRATGGGLGKVTCEIRSCAKHLDNKDDSYNGCYGGCCASPSG